MLSRDEQTYQIIGAAMEVHRVLKNGFLEQVYQEALAIELCKRQIPHVREAALGITYKGQKLSATYRADFICYNNILVETKALSQLSNNEKAQVINYLKATGHELALLINFGQPSLQYRRIVRSRNHPNHV